MTSKAEEHAKSDSREKKWLVHLLRTHMGVVLRKERMMGDIGEGVGVRREGREECTEYVGGMKRGFHLMCVRYIMCIYI